MRFQQYTKTQIIFFIACCTYAAASIAMLTHDLVFNKQYDTQIMPYGTQLFDSFSNGTLLTYAMEIRKYPLFLTACSGALHALSVGILTMLSIMEPQQFLEYHLYTDPAVMNFISRAAVLLSTVGIFVLLKRISQKILPDISPFLPTVLLLSSIVLLVFNTAARPHVPEAFLTLLTFHFSLDLQRSVRLRNYVLAFGSATLAVSALQSGIFAFIFPLWAVLWSAYRRPLLTRLFIAGAWMVPSALVTSLIGYPFLWNADLWAANQIGFGMGNQDFDSKKMTGEGFRALLIMLFGSEPFLFIFAAIGARIAWIRRDSVMLPIALYLALYCGFFALQSTIDSRMFIPILPFLALVGSVGLSRFQVAVIPLLVASMLMHGWMAVLGFRADTYEVAKSFIQAHPEIQPIATDMPLYFIGIQAKKASFENNTWLVEDDPSKYLVIPMKNIQLANSAIVYTGTESPGPDWHVCQSIQASPDDYQMFIWTDLPFALIKLFTIDRMGFNTTIYCRTQPVTLGL